MRAALLLCCVLAGLAIVAGTTCPSNGVICPTQCGNTWQQCTSTTTWAPSAVPAGTVCCNGNFVYPNDPCCAGATTAAPTTKASSTAAPTTKAPTTAAPTTKATTTTSGSCTLSQIFSQADFNSLFPNANVAGNRGDAGQYAIFSYNAIIQAAASYPAFGCTGTLTQRKRELAAFLGQTSQETSGWWSGQDYIWGYVYSTELCAPNSCSSYVDSSNTAYPPVAGQNYYGRGPIQVSWNYNYGAASLAITGNKNTFLNNPNLVLTDNNGVTAFKTAFWFWMTAQSPKPSCHDVMTGGFTPSAADTSAGRVAGYGLVTDIVNGGIECNTGSTPSPQSVNRVGYYSKYTNYFGVADTTNLYCNNMQSY